MSADLLSRWRAGATAASFTAVECAVLAEELMVRGAAVYRDAKNPDHGALSAQIVELQQRAHPGHLGAGGEVVEGPDPSAQGLFK